MSRILNRVPRSSRLSGFHRLTVQERRDKLVETTWLTDERAASLEQPACGLSEHDADAMIENVVGLHALPLSVALNFRVNGADRVVPMSVEEPSIVAAASSAARLTLAGGGFWARCDEPVLTCQVQLLDVADPEAGQARILAAKPELLALADSFIPRMVKRGGGARDLEVRVLSELVVVHVHVDVRDAMGANTVNTVAEGLADRLAELARGRVGLRILTNLSDRRKVTAGCRVPVEALASRDFPDGAFVARRVVEAQRFAELDPYRAVTHNKGVMNGVDAVLVAFGNDWRAVEAGAHAWAARGGAYRPLTRWWVEGDALVGELTLPMATSTVGGAARTHPGVKLALELAHVSSANDLGALAAAAGLATNLAALRALSTEGINRGHMALHARRVAAEAGAAPAQVAVVAAQLSAEGCYRPERARVIVAELAEEARA
ncbi:MAG: hydroxymethylglutaryl-CoA reductase, degradative [Myxococcus sp.]|nr:hydroxymethylglutaryl-CoA reductase, degradative [Myxococcus sp.]